MRHRAYPTRGRRRARRTGLRGWSPSRYVKRHAGRSDVDERRGRPGTRFDAPLLRRISRRPARACERRGGRVAARLRRNLKIGLLTSHGIGGVPGAPATRRFRPGSRRARASYAPVLPRSARRRLRRPAAARSIAPAGTRRATRERRAVPVVRQHARPSCRSRSRRHALKSSDAGRATASIAGEDPPRRIASSSSARIASTRPVSAAAQAVTRSRTSGTPPRTTAGAAAGRSCRRSPRRGRRARRARRAPTTCRLRGELVPLAQRCDRAIEQRRERAGRPPQVAEQRARRGAVRPSSRHSLSAFSHSMPSIGTSQSVHASSGARRERDARRCRIRRAGRRPPPPRRRRRRADTAPGRMPSAT